MHNRWMRGFLVFLLLVAAMTPSDAKPLPTGLEVKLAKGTLSARRDGVSVSIGSVTKMISVELSADGKTIVVKRPGDPDQGEEDTVDETFALATVEGKLANAKGMSFQVKKKYADAVAPFTAAVQSDPQPVYITNLLSALAMGKKLDDADKVLATHGKRIAPWLAWRLAVDKELAALVDRPAAKTLFPGGGKATSKLADGEKVAYSAAGFAAVEVYTGLSMGMPTEVTKALAIVELTTGTEVLRLSTETSCNEMDEGGCKQAKYTASNKKQRKVADAVLSQMGFEVLAEPLVDAQATSTPTAKDGRKIVEIKDGGTAIAVGKKQIPIPVELEVKSIAFVPKAVVLVHKVQTSSNIDGAGTWEMEVTAIPTP